MLSSLPSLLHLYLQFGGGLFIGFLLKPQLPPSTPVIIGRFLYWFGVPVSILAFLRHTPLTESLWIAPLVAWGAMGFALFLGWLWIHFLGLRFTPTPLNHPTIGSFLLASMVGNTGYLGYPICFALVGHDYLGWILFYDLLGNTIGSYGLGVLLATHYGYGVTRLFPLTMNLIKNPTLWSLGISVSIQSIPFPRSIDIILLACGWGSIALSVILIGMRLGQRSFIKNVQLVRTSLIIKMLLVPMVLGIGLKLTNLSGLTQLTLILQSAMPPAFATVVIAELYDLDRDFAVTTLTLGTLTLVVTLPLWLLLFSTNELW